MVVALASRCTVRGSKNVPSQSKRQNSAVHHFARLQSVCFLDTKHARTHGAVSPEELSIWSHRSAREHGGVTWWYVRQGAGQEGADEPAAATAAAEDEDTVFEGTEDEWRRRRRSRP